MVWKHQSHPVAKAVVHGSPQLNQTESCPKSMPEGCEYYLFQQQQEENVQFQRKVKPVHGKPTAQMILTCPVLPTPSCPTQGLGTCPHTQLPVWGPCWPAAIPPQEERTISSYPHTLPAVILISTSNWRPFPHLLSCSAASCPVPWMCTRSACKCWWQQCSCDTNFSLTNLCHVEGCITNTWIVPTEESRTRATTEKLGPFLFC